MIDILIAKTIEGMYFALVEKMDRQHLRQLRKSMQFLCPQCEEKVLLKIGDVNIPHFAHQRDTTCRSLFSEGESALHLAGKQQLYHFFNNTQSISVQLEPYLADLSQRPDLLVMTKTKQVPIEFQCSRIAVSEIKRRTKGYEMAHMQPIWIVQTSRKLKQTPQGITVYSLSHFEEQFLQSAHSNRKYFLSYDAKNQTFHYLSALLHIKGRKFIVNHRTLPITAQVFPFAEPNILTIEELESYYSLYMAERLRFLQQRIFYNRKGVKDPFLRRCYQLRLIPSELPAWIGIPVTLNRLSNEHNCEWQLAFLYFITKQQKTIDEVTREDLFSFAYLQGHLGNEAIATYEKYLLFLLSLDVKSSRTELSIEKQHEMKKLMLGNLQSEMKIEKI